MLVMTNYAENYASTIYQSLNSGRGVHFSKVWKETGDTLDNNSFNELVRAKENEPINLLISLGSGHLKSLFLID